MNTFKTTQDQAVASWIDSLNQLRMNELLQKLSQENLKFEEVVAELQLAKEFIANPDHILGSMKSKHGEIAEHLQVHISNARNIMNGLRPEFTFEGVGRTAPEDYLKGAIQIQSKFYVGDDGRRSFIAVLEHLDKYPDFIKNGGIYEIPNNQHKELVKLLHLKPSEMTKTQWNLLEKIREFEAHEGVSFESTINPTVIDYRDSQLGTASGVVEKEQAKLQQQSQQNKNQAYQNSKPTMGEATKVMGVSAVLEGGTSFALAIYQKRKQGRKLSDFTEKDWKEVGCDTTKGTLKGAVRGGAVYGLTNFTATPAAVATSFVTASYGISSLAIQMKRGNLTTEEFVEQSEIVCLDASVSAISSLLGQAMIPVPILGAIIGNVCGTFMYHIGKQYLGEHEALLLKNYKQGLDLLTLSLDIRYKELIQQLEKEFNKFSSLVQLAFDTDVNKAFESSIELARYVGVKEDKILKNIQEIDDFFLN